MKQNRLPAIRPFVPGQPYDAHLADEAVKIKRLILDYRFWQLLAVVVRFWMVEFWLTWQKKPSEEFRRERARRLRGILLDLGPTFIKVGQFLSVRRDLLPLEIAEELSLLQDQVPPFEIDLVKQILQDDLGRTSLELFSSFEEVAVASASIGQVHKAKLYDGTWVVVKVQRQDLWRIFYRDLGYMRLWIRLGRLLGLGRRAQAWLDLSDEFGRTLFLEIDFLEEGRNADKMRRLLRGLPQIKVPRVFWKYTGRRVLTLEYLPGTKIDKVQELNAQGIDLREVGNLLVECYLEQVVINGFFHADPHAGNLAVDDSGNVIIYDFGMMGSVTTSQRRALIGCIGAVAASDPVKLAKYLCDLGVVKQKARLEPIIRTLQPFIEYYGGKEVLDLDFRHLEHDIDKIIEDQALTLPATLAYLLRAGSALEGIIRTLKPNFSFVTASRPIIAKWALQPGFVDLTKAVLTWPVLQNRKGVKSAPLDYGLSVGPAPLKCQGEEIEHKEFGNQLKSLEQRLCLVQRLSIFSLLFSMLAFCALLVLGEHDQKEMLFLVSAFALVMVFGVLGLKR